MQANLTFTLLLTLKMTATKAVETSVTSTNSLSQDYTNLGNRLPQKCHDSPRFKPFTLINQHVAKFKRICDGQQGRFLGDLT